MRLAVCDWVSVGVWLDDGLHAVFTAVSWMAPYAEDDDHWEPSRLENEPIGVPKPGKGVWDEPPVPPLRGTCHDTGKSVCKTIE